MGIRGLTSLIKKNSKYYYEDHQLKDTLVIIDGPALTNYLRKVYVCQPSAFGGDYDSMMTVYIDFINLLLRCNVTPIFVLDGAYEPRKVETFMSRISENIKLYNSFNEIKSCNPYYGSKLIVNILNNMDIPFIQCHFEADAEIATLSKILNCPVISQDSDFYLNSVPYIPLDKICLDLMSKNNIINCKIYKVEKLLNSFGGLHTDYLPLVSALLGNDYIKPDIFASLLRINPGNYNCKLKLKRTVDWLKNHNTVYSAMKTMINNLTQNRDYIKKQIIIMIQDYNSKNSRYISCIIQHKRMSKYQHNLGIYSKVIENKILPPWLEQHFRKGIIDPRVLTIITMKICLFKAKIEDYEKPPYYEISFKILEIIFGLLLGKTDVITIFGRKNGDSTGLYEIKPYVYDPYVPLAYLNKMDIENRKNIILNLIGVKHFKGMPKEWELFTIALIYWAIYTDNRLTKHMISLIVCAMILNIENTEIYTQDKLSEDFSDKCSVEENIMKVKKHDSIKAMEVLSNYFQVNECNDEIVYYKIMHPLTQFQCCISNFMMLNSILDFPYSQCPIEKFYKGSFLYNFCLKMENNDNPELFVSQVLFDKLDSLNTVYQSIVDLLKIFM